MRTILPREQKYSEPQQRDNFYQQVLQRVEHLPGVVAAGYSTSVPLSWKGGTSGFYPEGLRDADSREWLTTRIIVRSVPTTSRR